MSPVFNVKSAGSAVTSGRFRLCYIVRLSYLPLPGTQGTVEELIIAAVQTAGFYADRQKVRCRCASGPSRSDYKWPDAVT